MNPINEQNKQNFLKENPLQKGISEGHNEYLGMYVPAGFFEDSKNQILKSMSETEASQKKTQIQPKRRLLYRLTAAAAVLLLFVSFFVFFNKTSLFNDDTYAENTSSFEGELIFNSLFVEDGNIDSYIDDYIAEDIIFEAVYENDNVIINSLTMEEDEADNYIDEYLIESFLL